MVSIIVGPNLMRWTSHLFRPKNFMCRSASKTKIVAYWQQFIIIFFWWGPCELAGSIADMQNCFIFFLSLEISI